MGRRIGEFREGLIACDPATFDRARRVAQALRGSGGTFGFPELSAVAALVEASTDAGTLRRVEGLIEYLHGLRHAEPSPPPVHAEWLTRASGVADGAAYPDLASAWRDVSAKSGLGERLLAERSAARLGLRAADLSKPSRSALRLVPEALMRRAAVLPVLEDVATVTVAAADPHVAHHRTRAHAAHGAPTRVRRGAARRLGPRAVGSVGCRRCREWRSAPNPGACRTRTWQSAHRGRRPGVSAARSHGAGEARSRGRRGGQRARSTGAASRRAVRGARRGGPQHARARWPRAHLGDA
ncbi:MAG: hypothetical protein EXR91_13305 [Gemmatimonadetes bacterium]|nr:hypothetical protein [Gemmatimonadota bacterium]